MLYENYPGFKIYQRMAETINEKYYKDQPEFHIIYIDTLYTLLEQGYHVWLVYDCFYGTGTGTDEEFKNLVQEAVWVSFVRFKLAYDLNKWEDIFEEREAKE